MAPRASLSRSPAAGGSAVGLIPAESVWATLETTSPH
jgi:hypothetical protein